MRVLQLCVLTAVLVTLPPTVRSADESEGVSLIKLIATPERYDGKRVRVIGYCWLEFEGDAIYLHEDDYLHGISENAVWLALSDEQRASRTTWRGRYVLASGVFRAQDRGHFGMFAGSLTKLTRLELWSDPKKPTALEDISPPPKPER